MFLVHVTQYYGQANTFFVLTEASKFVLSWPSLHCLVAQVFQAEGMVLCLVLADPTSVVHGLHVFSLL